MKIGAQIKGARACRIRGVVRQTMNVGGKRVKTDAVRGVFSSGELVARVVAHLVQAAHTRTDLLRAVQFVLHTWCFVRDNRDVRVPLFELVCGKAERRARKAYGALGQRIAELTAPIVAAAPPGHYASDDAVLHAFVLSRRFQRDEKRIALARKVEKRARVVARLRVPVESVERALAGSPAFQSHFGRTE